MWSIYDRLIETIPENLTVDDYISGSNWTMVAAGCGCGIALTVKSQARRDEDATVIRGERLRNVAMLAKSWDFTKASFGMAAINAYYNTPKNAEAMGCDISALMDDREKKNAFTAFADECAGKNVTVIGHFPNIEKQLAPTCKLSILERNPSHNDYPDSACEYILPHQDFVFITGMTFTNKTLPRLLQLCKNAKVALVGPSVPLSTVLFEYGVDYLCGYCVTDSLHAADCVKTGTRSEIFSAGVMIDIPCDFA